jgi:hypothetical protein
VGLRGAATRRSMLPGNSSPCTCTQHKLATRSWFPSELCICIAQMDIIVMRAVVRGREEVGVA